MTKYPYLGKHKKTDVIVLFLKAKAGIQMSGDHLGYISTKWKEDTFEKCPSTFKLVLRNSK